MSGSEDSYHAASIIVFAVIGIAVGTILEIFLKNFNSPIPYTVLLFYLGVAMSAVVSHNNIPLEKFLEVSSVSADLIVYGFLPALLFSETMNLNWHHVTQTFGQAVLLAGPGGVIVCMLLAICAWGILPFGWGWYYSFLFGAILCATDPVSVVALLKSTKASAKLTMTISGESLLNDGSAMILYLFFYKMINGKVFTFPSFLSFVAEMIFLSPAIGFVFGIITSRLMRRLNSPTSPRLDIQLLLTFVCGYGSFFVAEYLLDVSGVLACCTAGVVVSLFAPLHVLADHQFHAVWENVEWSCNTWIFLLAGFIGGGRSASQISGINFGYLLIFYVLLLVTRGIMTFMLLPVMNKVGQPFSVAETWFSTYAGLRGALCIALALSGADNASQIGHDETGEQLFFMVAGLSSLTLLINGSTSGLVLLKLKLVDDPNAPVSQQLQQVLLRIRLFLRMYLHRELNDLKEELGQYDEKELFRLCELMRPELGDEEHDIEVSDMIDEESAMESKVQHRKPHTTSRSKSSDSASKSRRQQRRLSLGREGDADIQQISMRISVNSTVDRDLLSYTRETFLNVVRARYQDSVANGKIGTSSASSKLLLHSLDVAMDYTHERLFDWEVIEQSLHPNPILVRIGYWIDSFFYVFGVYTGLVSRLDAYYERIAMYVLTNYIDAHEYAQSRIHFFLGGMIDGPIEDIAAPEERQVMLESEALIERARVLLSAIDKQDLLMLYTHRAAKVIIHKQGEMLEQIVREGIISEKNARSLFENYEQERDKLEMERARQDKDMLKGNISKKMEEEKEFRESFRGSSITGLSPMHPSFSNNTLSPAALNSNNNNFTHMESSSANVDVNESNNAQTAARVSDISSSPGVRGSMAGRKSLPVPIVGSSGIDARESFSEGTEMRGSYVSSMSMKRGDGIFNRLNNAANSGTVPPAPATGSPLIGTSKSEFK